MLGHYEAAAEISPGRQFPSFQAASVWISSRSLTGPTGPGDALILTTLCGSASPWRVMASHGTVWLAKPSARACSTALDDGSEEKSIHRAEDLDR